METWLRSNTRIMWLGTLPAAGGTLAGLLLVWNAGPSALGWLARIAGGLLLVISLGGLAWLVRQLLRPRLAYEAGHLLVYLRPQPLKVPIELVEGFLLGQGPSFLPGKRHRLTETSTLVIRLAERAGEWARIDVPPAMGSWCNHYVTIRGTWCEPLSVELAARLNARLAGVQQQLDRRAISA
ncbi:MAG: hypothetical protein WD847_10985 [Pirellulales bacterium]